MKMCSKCKTDQDESNFVKSPRYSDGLYPSCKTCRNQTRSAKLDANPLCIKCGVEPHTPKNAYCRICARIMAGENPVPKFRRDITNKDKCSKCKVEPRAKGKNYCRACANEYMSNWTSARGGSWKSKTPQQKERAIVRQYAHSLVKSGKLERGPCRVCGNLNTEFHHLNYNPRTKDVIDLCALHHDEVEKLKKSGLTDMDAVSYLSNQQSKDCLRQAGDQSPPS